MIILDSSCWLEYFLNGKGADHYANIIEESGKIIVPAIVLHEVFKVAMRASGEDSALAVAGILQQFPVIPVEENVAMYSAKFGQQYGLAMADSMILATAHIHHAELWTQDADFKGLAGVQYFAKT
ncbi:MAG: type II toxin-antitoxin system VapC family toxin [Mariprofundaceae bacterium]|nr:type II toxin-antitoxin system VapC family toxin [Mariprofundaceae bacterium]